MSWSVEKTLCFLVIFLLFFQAISQVLSELKAKEHTLKHLVKIEFFFEESFFQAWSKRASGSLIKLNWILTAAHNVADFNETVGRTTTQYYFYKVDVLAGTKDCNADTFFNAKTQRRTIYKNDVIVHGDYNPRRNAYDVALIYTKKKFEITNTVEPAKLLEPWMKFDADAKCVVQGWGHNKLIRNKDNKLDYSPDQPNHARQGTVSILNGESCLQAYGPRGFYKKWHFCYGCNSGKCEQTAPGDSGTPVVCALKKGENPLTDGVVFAVHSGGCKDVRKKCSPGGPSYGTDVRKIKSWIEKEANKRVNVDEPPDNMYPYLIAGAVAVATAAVKYFY